MYGCNCGHTNDAGGNCPRCRAIDYRVVPMWWIDPMAEADPPEVEQYQTLTHRAIALWDRITGKESVELRRHIGELTLVYRRDLYQVLMRAKGAEIELVEEKKQIAEAARIMRDMKASREKERAGYEILLDAARRDLNDCSDSEYELQRANSHLRGQITKLKKKLAATTAATPAKGTPDG